MRRTTLHASTLALALALGSALVATPATAQSQGGSSTFEVSAVIDPSGSSDYDGFDLDTGWGLGFGWRFAPHWTAELRTLFHDGKFAQSDTYQLGLRYGFDLGTSWRPFAVAGVHQQQTDLRREVVCVRAPCPPLRESIDDTGLFAGAGVDWWFVPRAALRLEGRVAVYDSDRTDDLEDTTDLTAGIVVRF